MARSGDRRRFDILLPLLLVPLVTLAGWKSGGVEWCWRALRAAWGSAPAAHRASSPEAVAYWKSRVWGMPMHVVQVDPRAPGVRITVATAGKGLGSRDTWHGILERSRPAAAVTGTYFCTQSNLPVGTIIVGRQPICRGYVGTALACSDGNGAWLIPCPPGAKYDWSLFDTVLRAGPRLLAGGSPALAPRLEGFRDPAIFARKARTVVALTRQGKLLLIAVPKPVWLDVLAGALRELDAVEAMCLDGGMSTGLYYRGQTRVKPRRTLTNLLVVYDSSARYEQVARTLTPFGPHVAQAPPTRRLQVDDLLQRTLGLP